VILAPFSEKVLAPNFFSFAAIPVPYDFEPFLDPSFLAPFPSFPLKGAACRNILNGHSRLGKTKSRFEAKI